MSSNAARQDKVRDDVDQLLMSEGFEVHSDDDRLQHLLLLHQLTKDSLLLHLGGQRTILSSSAVSNRIQYKLRAISIRGLSAVVFKVCIAVMLFVILVSLLITVPSREWTTPRSVIANTSSNWTYESDNQVCVPAVSQWSESDDGRWYDFSCPPLFVFYVYSAFLVDHGPQNVIRFISITSPVELLVRRQLDVFCVLRDSDRNTFHVASILRRPPKQITEPAYVKDYEVGDYVYTCPLPQRHQHHLVPTELSIVYKTSQATELSNASFFMPVEVPRRGKTKNNVAVCVQATFGHIDRQRLVEWFEMQRLLGVSHVGVATTPTAHPDTRRTLAEYAATPLVELRAIDYVADSGNGHNLTVNLAAINDCFYRHIYTHEFIAVVDFDEVIMPRKHRLLADMMSELHAKMPPPAANFIFLNTYFFIEGKPDANISTNFTIARMRHRVTESPYLIAVKSVVVAEYCVSMHYHRCCELVDPSAERPVAYDVRLGDVVVNVSDALSHHYRSCSTTRHKAGPCGILLGNTFPDDTVLRYRHQLIDNVQRILDTGILHHENATAEVLSRNAAVV